MTDDGGLRTEGEPMEEGRPLRWEDGRLRTDDPSSLCELRRGRRRAECTPMEDLSSLYTLCRGPDKSGSTLRFGKLEGGG